MPICLPQLPAERETADRPAKLAQTLTETKGKLRAKERERTAFPEPQLEKLEDKAELYPLSCLVQGEPQAAQIEVASVTLSRKA